MIQGVTLVPKSFQSHEKLCINRMVPVNISAEKLECHPKSIVIIECI